MPQQWNDAQINSIYKKNGDHTTSCSSREISFLSVAGKLLVKILLASRKFVAIVRAPHANVRVSAQRFEIKIFEDFI